MAINKEDISKTYDGRDMVLSKIKLWRRAFTGSFDEGKFKFFGEPLTKEQLDNDRMGPQDAFLMRFERETNKSFFERLNLSTNPGITEMVGAGYTDSFNKAKKTVEIKGVDGVIEKRLQDNFDGEGHSVQEFMCKAFDEMIQTDDIYGVTDTIEVAPANGKKTAINMPIGYLVPRENILNFHVSEGGFDFVTWKSSRSKVTGITVVSQETIVIFTRDELAVAVKKDKGWVVETTTPNNLDSAPVRMTSLNGGRSLLHSIAGIEFNLFNLDSEQRRFLRNVVAMNFLVVQKQFFKDYEDGTGKVAFDMQSMITSEQNGGEIKWVGYPQGSLSSFDEYWDRRLKLAIMVSRQRQQKKGAETEKAKVLDFSQPGAVLNAAADKIEKLTEDMILDMGKRMGRPLTVKATIDRDFHPERLKETLEVLDMLLDTGFGKTFEDIKKMEFVDKHKVSPEERKKIKGEVEVENPKQDEFFSTADLDQTGEKE